MASASLQFKALTSPVIESLSDDETAGLRGAFKRAFASCRSRAEWCFAAETGGRTVSLLGYRAPAAHDDLEQTPQTMILFFLQSEGNSPEVDQALLEHSWTRLRAFGASRVKWSFDSADFWGEISSPHPHWQQTDHCGYRRVERAHAAHV